MKFRTKLPINLIIHASIIGSFYLLAFVINDFPEGNIIAGGDFYQLINIKENLSRYLFTWINQIGQGQYNPLIVTFPFYAIQYFLFYIGFTYTDIANAVIFLFFIGSYYSFYFAIKIINEDIPQNIRFLISGIYTLNVFTFTIFTYPWWITHHFLIYIFIPILFAVFEKLITTFSKRNIALYSIVFLLATISFNNVAFWGALLFLQVLLLISSFLTKKIPLTISSIKRIFFTFTWQVLLSIYFLLPFFVSQFEYISKVTQGDVIGDYVNWLSYTSTNVYNILSFTMVEDKYPIVNLFLDSKIFLAISLGYMILLLYAILINTKGQEKNWLRYLIIFIPYLFLLMRMTPPYDRINRILYALPGLNLFRSPDKLFVFYPFFYLVLLGSLLLYSKLSEKVISTLLILILMIPVPFFIGGIPTYLTHLNQAGYKYSIRIPEEYYRINEDINDDTQLSIISLPYSVINSINWSNYPKWEFVGFDILHLLFNKQFISANVYDHVGFEKNLSFMEYNETGEVNRMFFISLLQKFSGQYILYHKDISKYWQDNSVTVANTLEILESENLITKEEENEYFILYELDNNLLTPLIYSEDSKLFFQKINPTQYRLNIQNITEETNLVFHQSYNSQWKLYLVSNPNNSWCRPEHYYEKVQTTECESYNKISNITDLKYIWKNPYLEDTHLVFQDYANGWIINPEYLEANYSPDYYSENLDGGLDIELVINFKPQSYFLFGIILSGIVLIGSLIYLIWYSFGG